MWRIAAALSSPKDGMCFTVLDEILGNAVLGLEVVLSFFQRFALHQAYLSVHAVLPAGKICQKTWDPVVTRGGVVVKV